MNIPSSTCLFFHQHDHFSTARQDGGDILNGCDPNTAIGGFLLFPLFRSGFVFSSFRHDFPQSQILPIFTFPSTKGNFPMISHNPKYFHFFSSGQFPHDFPKSQIFPNLTLSPKGQSVLREGLKIMAPMGSEM